MGRICYEDLFFFLWYLNPTLRTKLLCAPLKIVYAPQACNTGSGPTTCTVLTKPTESAQPSKLTVCIMPTMLSLPAMPTDLACMPI